MTTVQSPILWSVHSTCSIFNCPMNVLYGYFPGVLQDPNRATQFLKLSFLPHLFNFNQILSILVFQLYRGGVDHAGVFEEDRLPLWENTTVWFCIACSRYYIQLFILAGIWPEWCFVLPDVAHQEGSSISWHITMSDIFYYLPRQCLPGFLTNHYFKEHVSTKYVSSPLINL